MKCLGVRKRGELRHGFKLPEEVPDNFTGVVAATELLHLLQDSAKRRFGLRDGHLGVILAVLFQTAMVFPELLAEELDQTLAGGAVERPR